MLSEVESNIARIGSYELSGGGCAFLIGNGDYGNTNATLPKVTHDIKLMKNSLKALNFEVKSQKDINRNDIMKNIVCDIIEEDLSQYSSFVFYFSGHGSNGNIYGSDSKKVNILEHIVTPIGLKRHFEGKPKIFLFDCCRTNKSDIKSDFTIPPDVYVAYATSMHGVSFDGGWTKHLAAGLLECAFLDADRWISSLHNVLTFARCETFKGDKQLAVSGDDSLMKLVYAKISCLHRVLEILTVMIIVFLE